VIKFKILKYERGTKMINNKIRDILKYEVGEIYEVGSYTNIPDAIGELVKEALKSYCSHAGFIYNSVTKKTTYMKCMNFEDMINQLLVQFDENLLKKKMTVNEIEEKLGYKIEIISK
jgi:choline kinase